MQYLVVSFFVVFPLFIRLAIGFVLKHTHIMSDQTFREMNNVTFRLFLPVLIFSNIYQADLSKAVSVRLIVFSVCSLLVMFILSMVLIPRFEPLNKRRGVLVQAICRSNFVIFGLPVATSLYGTESAGIASILVGIVVPVINTLSVIALEYYHGEKPDIKKIIKSILLNPIIWGAFLGMLMVVTGLRLPHSLNSRVTELAQIATPLALIVLGGSVTFVTMGTHGKQLVSGVVIRLIGVPLIGLTVAILLGFRNIELVILMAMFASPAAISSYTMAQQMDGDADLAGQLVIFTTLFSIVTIFLWTYALMQFGFI
jgi:malate permease and related proteins